MKSKTRLSTLDDVNQLLFNINPLIRGCYKRLPKSHFVPDLFPISVSIMKSICAVLLVSLTLATAHPSHSSNECATRPKVVSKNFYLLRNILTTNPLSVLLATNGMLLHDPRHDRPSCNGRLYHCIFCHNSFNGSILRRRVLLERNVGPEGRCYG